VRAWLDQQPSISAQPSRRLELAATLMRFSLYRAALEWRKAAGTLTAEAFTYEAIPLITATIAALGS
jgi:hypothetical protein